MEQHEMVELIRGGVGATGGVWADFGAGSGNFSWALAELLGPDGTIYTLDRDARAIAAQRTRLLASPPLATVVPQQADVARSLTLPPLDGVLSANVLHFLRHQETVLRQWAETLKPTGRLLIVEYEQMLPIPWVPFPVPFARFAALAGAIGFAVQRVGTRRSPSSGREMYAAVATRTPTDATSATSTD